MEKTLQVRIHGGPGVGKSTTRSEVFSILKKRGYNVEDVPEYAKNLVWETAVGKLGFQPYIMAKQMWHMRRLEGQVSAIITDTSTLLSLIYGNEEHGVTPEFRNYIIAEYKATYGLDFFLERNPNNPYTAIGRNQNADEAKAYDTKIKALLEELEINVINVRVSESVGLYIADYVEGLINAS